MADPDKSEVWLRGPLPAISPLLQPVAHALLQAREEVNELMKDFTQDLLWQRPAGVASAGFHLQHMAGVLDRLFTYAKEEMLSKDQLQFLLAEGQVSGQSVEVLLQQFNEQVDRALDQLRNTNEEILLQRREVGRSKIPSTTLGLYVHAAEHTMRHLGQLLVTVRIVTAGI
jgi:hypothetical protein